MVAIRIEGFSGMAPKLSNRLLPNNAATTAENTRLLSGELRGARRMSPVYKFPTGDINTVMRAVKDDGDFVWIGLTSPDADIVKGPLLNDSIGRYYWTGETNYLQYNSLTRITDEDPSYKVGVPAPTTAPTIAVVGGSDAIESRSYTYTFINEWNEESAPAPVLLVSGFVNGSWNLSALPSAAVDPTGRCPVDKKRIYRTVTGQSTVSYFFVAEIPIADTTYNDTSVNLTVASNNILQTFNWAPPPDNLTGLIAHPNGFLVGFVGRDIYMSERFRPHAWPVQYMITVEHQVVGLAIYNNMITVLTRGKPNFAAGTHPAGMSLMKSDSAEPCLSKGSIASTLAGVLYSSPNGLVLFNESGANIVTKQIISIEEWANYSPSNISAAQYGEQYVAFYTSEDGFRYAPGDPFGVFSEIDNIGDVDNITTDHSTGQCWLIRNNAVEQWEPVGGVPLNYRWLSKVFDVPRPLNFGALMVKMAGASAAEQADTLAMQQEFNNLRIGYTLNPFNASALNGTIVPDIGNVPEGVADVPGYRQPLGGSALYDIAFATAAVTATAVQVYADGRLIMTQSVEDSVMHRMPSGFKAHTWQVELIGNRDVYSFVMAETAKELDNG